MFVLIFVSVFIYYNNLAILCVYTQNIRRESWTEHISTPTTVEGRRRRKYRGGTENNRGGLERGIDLSREGYRPE